VFLGVFVSGRSTIGRPGASPVITELAPPVARPPRVTLSIPELAPVRLEEAPARRGAGGARAFFTLESCAGAGPGPPTTETRRSPPDGPAAPGGPPSRGLARTSSTPTTSLSPPTTTTRRTVGPTTSAPPRGRRTTATNPPEPGTPLPPRRPARAAARAPRSPPPSRTRGRRRRRARRPTSATPTTSPPEKSRAETSTAARTFCAPGKTATPTAAYGGARFVDDAPAPFAPRRRGPAPRHGLQEVRRGQRSTCPNVRFGQRAPRTRRTPAHAPDHDPEFRARQGARRAPPPSTVAPRRSPRRKTTPSSIEEALRGDLVCTKQMHALRRGEARPPPDLHPRGQIDTIRSLSRGNDGSNPIYLSHEFMKLLGIERRHARAPAHVTN
jgi:hypothetical protein